jgi:REP element-mobilizing transposase RayT
MSDKYKIREKEKAYFVTLTTVGWVDIFTRPNHKLLIINSLKYCIENKGLIIFAYCLMPSHLHMICRADGNLTLSDILRDFKTFTSKNLINQITEEPESRRDWMLSYFKNAGESLKRIKNYKFWQDGNQAKIIFSKEFFYEKLEYLPVRQAGIHNNPVEEMIVEHPEDYLFSSARNYAGLDSLIEVVLESSKLITY